MDIANGYDPLIDDDAVPILPLYQSAAPSTIASDYTVDEWLTRLNARLDRRIARMRRYVDYYDGRHVIKLVSDRFRNEFARRFPEYADNFMPLVVDTEAHRLHVQGIRYGPGREGDADAWRWWQANHLDADAALAHTDALLKGCTNVMVWKGPRDAEPKVTLEDAMQTVVDTVPGRRWERRAALKRWLDDDKHLRAELYLPDVVLRFHSEEEWSEGTERVTWRAAAWGGASQVDNPLRVVPIVPLVNRPRLSRLMYGSLTPDDDGTSELEAVIGNQDHINAYRMMAVVASEFASFRQRYAIGLEVAIDPLTGRPKPPFDAGVDRLWVIPPPDPQDYPDASQAPRVQLGEFDQTDTAGLRELIRDELHRMATKAQMPYHYLLESQSVPPSGESIKSAEDAFVMKVEDAQVTFGEAWEEVFRLNYLWRRDAKANIVDAEVFWASAESRSEAVLTDAMVKAKSFGVADEILQERWGMSPQEIERNRQLRAAEPKPPPAPPPAPNDAPGAMPVTPIAQTGGTGT